MSDRSVPLKDIPVMGQQDQDILKVARGGGISFVGAIVTRGLNYLYSMVLVWGLGGENFGLYILSLAIVNFLGVLAELGLGLGIVRFGAIFSRERGQSSIHKITMIALRISIPLALIFLLTLYATANLIADDIFHKPQLEVLIKILVWSIPFMSAQSLLIAATKACMIMKYAVFVLIAQSLSAFLFAVLFLTLRLGLQSVAISFVLSYIVGAGLALYYYVKIIPRQADVEPLPMRQLVKFSVPLSLTKWIQFANERTEVLFLGLLPSTLSVGIYKVAWSLAGLETMLRLSLEEILGPFSSDLSHRKEIKQLESLYKTTAKWSFTGALMFCFVYLLFGRTIMNLFDPTFVIGTGVLVLLAFAQLFNESTGTCGIILIMCGRSDLSLLNTIALFISSITLDWILIPRYGLSGAAFAGAFTIIFVNFLRVVEVWMILKIQPITTGFIKPIIAGLSGAVIVWVLQSFVYSGTLLVDVIYGLFFVMLYALGIFLLKLDTADLLVLGVMGRKITSFVAKGRAA